MDRFSSKYYLLPAVVLAVGALATWVTWSQVDQRIRDAEELRFTRYSDRVISTIQERLRDQERLLEGGRGLFYASKSVEFDEWSAYVKAQKLDAYPGILGLGYIARVPRESLPDYVAGVRKEAPNFEVKTKGEHADLFVIQQIEPAAGNEPAWGFDIGQEANRREGAEAAALSGMATLTKKISLVQDQKKVAGFLMLLPIYKAKTLPVDLVERKRELIGWTYVPIRAEELMAGIVASTDNMLDFEVVDGESRNRQDLIYDADGHLSATTDAAVGAAQFASRAFYKKSQIETQGRVWTIFTSSGQEFERTAAHAQWVIPVGTLLSLLAALVVWSLSNSRRNAQSLADVMSLEARDSEARMRAIVDSVMDAIIVIDDAGLIRSFNHAAERMFGYTGQEMLGNNIGNLMPEPYRREHAGYMKHYLDTGEARVIGKVLELTGQRNDGSTFPIELAVTRIDIKGKAMFTGIVRDITERQKVDRMKREFVSTVSHELRTPLTSIRGSLGLIAGGAMGEVPPPVRQLVDIAYNNCERLVRLINDILDIEKIESGKIAMTLLAQPIMPLVEQSLEANCSYAEQYRVNFNLVSRLDGAVVTADADRFMQVMANLLSNAAKFSPAQGVVDVAVALQAGRVRISVTDHGSGIPEQFRDRIFQKFTQADSSDTRQKGGTGLGLAICKALVECMGGTIGYASEAGCGTTFYFDLPRVVTTDRPLQGQVEYVPRILICEDSPDVALRIASMLTEAGYATDIAPTIAAAKKQLAECAYAAITLDLDMPDQEGLNFLRELRRKPATQSLPVIALKASVDVSETLQDASVAKPIDPDRFMRAMQAAVRGSVGGKARILHIEDDPDIQQIVGAVASSLAEFDFVSDLASARDRLSTRRYDMVILDLALPDGEGWELLQSLNQLNPPPPVLVFSASEVSRNESAQVAAALVQSQTSNQVLLRTLTALIAQSPQPTTLFQTHAILHP